MKMLPILLSISLLLLAGCENGSVDEPGTVITESAPTVTETEDSSDGTLVTTITSENAPLPDGSPQEGDTKTEIYTFTKPDGSPGKGTKVYTYEDGEWMLVSATGDNF